MGLQDLHTQYYGLVSTVTPAHDDILNLLIKKRAEVAQNARCGLILQPGAIGDCILTLPLAAFMKKELGLGRVDILGHTEYIGIFPGRTCVDSIRSIDLVEMHRLFVESETFELADNDTLLNVFAEYTWIVTFLGEPGSSFEQNLIFAVNCTRSAEVITLPLKSPKDSSEHITDFYLKQFAIQSGMSLEPQQTQSDCVLIKYNEADVSVGRRLLAEIGIDEATKAVVIQPGGGGLKKCWRLENFLAVARELIGRGLSVVFLLGPAELERFSKDAIKSIRAVAKCAANLSLTEALGLLSCAYGFVGNDSGITHLAAGMGIKTVAIFGPSDPTVYKPVGAAVTVLHDKTTAFAERESSPMQGRIIELLGQ